ncbi:hypothetical protein ACFL5V_07700 [Fibrobacterota bacterium]
MPVRRSTPGLMKSAVLCFLLFLFSTVSGNGKGQDLRTTLKSFKQLAMIVNCLDEQDLARAESVRDKIKPVLEKLDKKFGGDLKSTNFKTREDGLKWVQHVSYQSINLSFSNSLENFSDSKLVKEQIRIIMKDFRILEAQLAQTGSKGFNAAREVRKLIQRSISLMRNKQKFQDNCEEIKISIESVFPHVRLDT